MSNSPLVAYTKISPNKTTNRNHKIDTITIHCVAGNMTIESLGSMFAKSSVQASSNYGIGTDGRVGMYVEEKDRSWATSSAANDHRAITIEVSNDGPGPEWHVSQNAYDAVIRLCADICKRNGIKELKWKEDKSLIGKPDQQNMTVHRWFANKGCPGNFLYKHMGDIAWGVNYMLENNKDIEPIVPFEQKPFKEYQIHLVNFSINIRKGPGINYPSVKVLVNDKNAYTIVEEKEGPGATMWCRLKSGLGWISKDYVKVL